jgi:hypothetical protein
LIILSAVERRIKHQGIVHLQAAVAAAVVGHVGCDLPNLRDVEPRVYLRRRVEAHQPGAAIHDLQHAIDRRSVAGERPAPDGDGHRVEPLELEDAQLVDADRQLLRDALQRPTHAPVGGR